jgi:hypothetical protein
MPHGNEREIEELPEEVRNSVTFHAVKSMDDVLVVALRPAPPAPPATVGPRAKRAAAVPVGLPAPDTVTH